jgi:hypothetical protein
MLTVQFISEPPHTNWGVEVTYSNQLRPDALLTRLIDLGWKGTTVDPSHWPNGTIRFHKACETTWSDKQHKANVLAVRRVMEHFGIHNISHKKLR